jgi:transcriptional regulator with XRE-family HTH domain
VDRKQEVVLLKVLGARMREGRQLCKFTVQKSAELIGCDPEYLHNLETCVDINHVPLSLIRDASNIYDVSIDFLFGMNDDWEKCEETKSLRAIHSYIYKAQLKHFSEVAVELVKLKKLQEAMAKEVSSLAKSITSIEQALDRFIELNPEYDELRAGSTLIYRVKEASKAVTQAVLKLKRLHVNIDPKSNHIEV